MMQGKKTHEQQIRTLERKEDIPDARQTEAELGNVGKDDRAHIPNRELRESEFPVSRGGFNQESDHNKHNRGGQEGHAPQKHTPAEEKH